MQITMHGMKYERYMANSCKLQDTINTMKRDEIPVTNTNDNNAIKTSTELPKIKIPDFDGKISNWNHFHELFESIIHKSKNINDTTKLHYLKTFVSGEAARLISHLQPNAENCTTAYDILVKRYENTRILLGKLLDSITEFPQLTNETCSGLKNLHDTVYECMAGIANLNINTEKWDGLMAHFLVEKLDKETRKHYECQLENPREPQKINDRSAIFFFLNWKHPCS